MRYIYNHDKKRTSCIPQPQIYSAPIHNYICTEIVKDSGHIVLFRIDKKETKHVKKSQLQTNTPKIILTYQSIQKSNRSHIFEDYRINPKTNQKKDQNQQKCIIRESKSTLKIQSKNFPSPLSTQQIKDPKQHQQLQIKRFRKTMNQENSEQYIVREERKKEAQTVGKVLLVQEISKQVLPTAPSPTVTHFMNLEPLISEIVSTLLCVNPNYSCGNVVVFSSSEESVKKKKKKKGQRKRSQIEFFWVQKVILVVVVEPALASWILLL